MEELKQIV